MKYTIPDYYREFHCIAGECPATCCAGWQIVIDEKALKKYSAYQGPFGSRLANSIDWEEKTFRQYGGRCAFLDEENLCDIYSEAGPEYLCRTCRRYPRHVEEFENEREISLSLSCPVVAELLLGRREKVHFLSKERRMEEEEDESFDFFLYSVLQDTRSAMIEMLQDRSRPAAFRMAKVLALAHDIQNRIDTRRLFEAESVLERYQRNGADKKLEKQFAKYRGLAGQPERIRGLFGLLDELEVLDESWPGRVEGYRRKLKAGLPGSADWWNPAYEIEAEQLTVYFLFTYFCGAVYDGDALSKVKMALVSVLLLLEMEHSQFQQQEDRREDEHKVRAEIAWKFSRELEHSDLNLEKMEELMREHPAAEFTALLKCILY